MNEEGGERDGAWDADALGEKKRRDRRKKKGKREGAATQTGDER